MIGKYLYSCYRMRAICPWQVIYISYRKPSKAEIEYGKALGFEDAIIDKIYNDFGEAIQKLG